MVVPESSRVPRPVWSDVSARVELSGARRRVLETLASCPTSMTAAEIGAVLDLHHNTVREHLDALVEVGFVTVSTQATGRRGRPALHYSTVGADPHQVLAGYVTLLGAVAETLESGTEARQTALAIGRRWAERTEAEHPELVTSRRGPVASVQPVHGSGAGAPSDGGAPQGAVTGDDAPTAGDRPGPGAAADNGQALLADLAPELARLGFDPHLDGADLILRSCPLVTEGRPPHPLVCVMHEGFLDAVARRRGGRVHLHLEPMAGPGCRVTS